MQSNLQFEAEHPVFTVTNFNRAVKNILESSLGQVWIKGEISNLRRQASGHIYFSLKDTRSQVSCVFFRGNAARCPVAPANGMQVTAFGETSVYEPRGNYQLIIRTMVDDGLGALQQKFEALKSKLAAEGLFDPSIKMPLPALPQKVGFVTSPTGAAIRDFISVLERRHWKGQLVVIPARVQGKEAADEIVRGIQQAEELGGLDLVVIGRGGGSLEDLWPFNEERVVRAVAAASLPIISAVGHQIDFALSDFAADHRAETPTAAAELISSRYLEQLERIRHNASELTQLLRQGMTEKSRRMELNRNHLRLLAPDKYVEALSQKLDDLSLRLKSTGHTGLRQKRADLLQIRTAFLPLSPEQKLKREKEYVEQLQDRLNLTQRNRIHNLVRKVNHLKIRLHNSAPDQILRRGFVMMKGKNGEFLTRAEATSPGDEMTARFYDKSIEVVRKPD